MTSGIGRKAVFLAGAGLLKYAVQMALPVILVRHRTKQEFGDYRLIGLVAATGLILVPLFLSESSLLPAALCRVTPDAHAKVLLTKRNGAECCAALERRLPFRQRAKWAQIKTGRVKGLVSEHRVTDGIRSAKDEL